jgi:hypothetical protein
MVCKKCKKLLSISYLLSGMLFYLLLLHTFTKMYIFISYISYIVDLYKVIILQSILQKNTISYIVEFK